MHVFEELTLFLVSKVTSSKPQRIEVNVCVNRMWQLFFNSAIDSHVRASKNLFRESKIGPLFKLNWREEEIPCVSGSLTSVMWFGGWIWAWANFRCLKKLLTSKVVKSDPKLIIFLLLTRLSKNPWYTLYVGESKEEKNATTKTFHCK